MHGMIRRRKKREKKKRKGEEVLHKLLQADLFQLQIAEQISHV